METYYQSSTPRMRAAEEGAIRGTQKSLWKSLHSTNILEAPEIAEFVRIFVQERPTENDHSRLQALLQHAIDRFHDYLDEAQQEEFRQGLASYGRFYSFLTAVIDLQDTALELLHINEGHALERITDFGAYPYTVDEEEAL